MLSRTVVSLPFKRNLNYKPDRYAQFHYNDGICSSIIVLKTDVIPASVSGPVGIEHCRGLICLLYGDRHLVNMNCAQYKDLTLARVCVYE